MNRGKLLIALMAALIGYACGYRGIHLESMASAEDGERPQVVIDDASAVAVYANFARVTGTPEELILDFGLNPQPIGTPRKPIAVTQRIVLNFYTAKRMAHALDATLQRHEATFGELETDVQKRVKGAPAKPASPKP